MEQDYMRAEFLNNNVYIYDNILIVCSYRTSIFVITVLFFSFFFY